MRFIHSPAVWIALAAATTIVPLSAQLQNNTEKQLSCNNGNNDGDRARHCEVREQTLPATGRLNVDAGTNGGVSVKGALRSDVLVRARIEASGDTEAAAANLASQVSLDTSTGEVRAIGPQSSGENAWWSVSYEIFVPQTTDLDLKAHNGGLTISDVRGQIRFQGNNGGVHLKRVAGDVSGGTVNGGVQLELTGAIWEGRQLDVKTQNGGINVTMPSYYSAHVQAETSSGRIQSDFATMVDANQRPRQLDFNVGSGGPLIHLTTTNGGVRLKRAEVQ